MRFSVSRNFLLRCLLHFIDSRLKLSQFINRHFFHSQKTALACTPLDGLILMYYACSQLHISNMFAFVCSFLGEKSGKCKEKRREIEWREKCQNHLDFPMICSFFSSGLIQVLSNFSHIICITLKAVGGEGGGEKEKSWKKSFHLVAIKSIKDSCSTKLWLKGKRSFHFFISKIV